jgi:selT/selW/selH-like putative selenoprotein
VQVEIFYCPTSSGYDTRAASLAAELERAGHDVTATPGGNGQFDVLAEGGLVFSKAEHRRFPEDGEILGVLG